MDKQTESLAREKFEKWFNEQMVMPIIASNETVVRLMWKAWKASWESLVVVPVNSPELPDGWKLVPIEPTESMVIDGFESAPDQFFSEEDEWNAYQEMSGCQQAAHRAKLCWAAMLAAAPTTEK